MERDWMLWFTLCTPSRGTVESHGGWSEQDAYNNNWQFQNRRDLTADLLNSKLQSCLNE